MAARIPVYGFYPFEDDENVAQPLAAAMICEAARLHDDGALGGEYDFSPGLFYTAGTLLDAIRRHPAARRRNREDHRGGEGDARIPPHRADRLHEERIEHVDLLNRLMHDRQEP